MPGRHCRGGAHLTALAIAALVFILSFGLMQAIGLLAAQDTPAHEPMPERPVSHAPMPSSGASSGAAAAAGAGEEGPPAGPSQRPPADQGQSAPVSAPPAPRELRPGPRVYAHVLSPLAAERVRRLEADLLRSGIVLAGIKVVGAGPASSDLRYFRAAEKEEAARVQAALLALGLPARRLKHIAGFEVSATPRQYELWLSDDFR